MHTQYLNRYGSVYYVYHIHVHSFVKSCIYLHVAGWYKIVGVQFPLVHLLYHLLVQRVVVSTYSYCKTKMIA